VFVLKSMDRWLACFDSKQQTSECFGLTSQARAFMVYGSAAPGGTLRVKKTALKGFARLNASRLQGSSAHSRESNAIVGRHSIEQCAQHGRYKKEGSDCNSSTSVAVPAECGYDRGLLRGRFIVVEVLNVHNLWHAHNVGLDACVCKAPVAGFPPQRFLRLVLCSGIFDVCGKMY